MDPGKFDDQAIAEAVLETKLPHYDIKAHGRDSPSSPDAKHHQLSLLSVPIAWNVDAIFKSFASFVSAITELQTVAFVAEYPSENDQITTRLTIAKTTPLDIPHSFDSKETQLHILDERDIQGSEYDFGISIFSPASPPTSLRPFTLHLTKSETLDHADIHLYYSTDHGPETAASNLLSLAVAYMSSASAEVPQPEISALNYPLLDATIPPLKVDLPSSGGFENESSMLLHSAFERRAAQTPDAIAVESVQDKLLNAQQLTYQALNAKADNLAAELQAMVQHMPNWQPAFGSQRVVPLFIPGSAEFYAGALGASKAGMAFCPLHLDAPPHRLVEILDDVQACVVLGIGETPFPGLDLDDPAAKELLQKFTWVNINEPGKWRSGNPALAEVSSYGWRSPVEQDLAYILYTSGSTGKPKGVLISHEMVTCYMNFNAQKMEPFPSGAELRWLQFGMPTFDLTMLEIFLTLSYGGTLCVADRRLMLSDIESVINFFQATAVTCVPSLATLIRRKEVPNLRYLICGGEILTKYAIDNFSYDASTSDPPVRLINVYGPTETTINNTAETIPVGTRGSVAGDPLACCSILIVDSHRTDEVVPVPMGLSGEIILAGPLVSYGYLNRPKESAIAFTSGLGFDRVYRTGDKGRIVWNDDGVPKLEVLGRLSMEQVKLNGRRVEMAEIESTITEVPGVKDTATAVLDNSFVVAYIAVAGDRKDTDHQNAVIEECQSVAKRRVPDWMRPKHYVVVDAIPRIPSGKVDRKTLQKQVAERFGNTIAQSAAADSLPLQAPSLDFNNAQSVESVLSYALQQALGGAAAGGVDSSLKAAGLDSLRSMKFLQHCRGLGIIELDMKSVLSRDSLKELVPFVMDEHERLAAEADASESVPDDIIIDLEDEEQLLELSLAAKLKHFSTTCRPVVSRELQLADEEIVAVLPATSLQTRIFAGLEEATELGIPKPWIEHFPYKAPGHVDVARLKDAIRGAMASHDAFRAVFTPVDHPLAPFAQCILSPDSPRASPPIVEMTAPAYSDKPGSLWQRLITHAQQTAEATFGLNSLSSVVTILQSADGKNAEVVFSFFHAIYDGMSLQKLASDMAQLYHGEALTPSSRLESTFPVDAHFSADWLESTLFWTRRLAGVPGFKVGQRVLSSSSASQFESCGAGTGFASQNLQSSISLADLFGKSRDLQLPDLMAAIQAVWAITLARTLVVPDADKPSSLDVQFAGVYHGRQTAESLDAFALMIATFPSRVAFDLTKPTTYRQIYDELHDRYIEALPYAELPCPNVQFARSTRRFDSSLMLQVFPDAGNAVQSAGLPAFNRFKDGLAPWRETNAGYPVLMEIWPGSGGESDGLNLRCSYSEGWPGYSFTTPEWIHGILSSFDAELRTLLGNPDAVFDLLDNLH